jgi:hypothetical protein
MPANPALSLSLSWFSDPSIVHKNLDRHTPIDQIPAPFNELARKLMASFHGLVDVVASDVVLALYFDKAGRASLVLAADVKDEAKAQAELRKLEDVLVSLVEQQRALVGNNAAAQFSAKTKFDGVKLGAIKGDGLTIKMSKDAVNEDEFGALKPFLSRDSLEITSFAGNKVAALVIGADSRKLATTLARGAGKGTSLGQDKGLEHVRAAMGGCQLCVSFDPIELVRLAMSLKLEKIGKEDRKYAADLKSASAKLNRMKGFDGSMGAGVRLTADRGAFGWAVDKETLMSKQFNAELIELIEVLESPIEDDVGSDAGPKPAKPKARTNQGPASKGSAGQGNPAGAAPAKKAAPDKP